VEDRTAGRGVCEASCASVVESEEDGTLERMYADREERVGSMGCIRLFASRGMEVKVLAPWWMKLLLDKLYQSEQRHISPAARRIHRATDPSVVIKYASIQSFSLPGR
jgi:hypothetical protein